MNKLSKKRIIIITITAIAIITLVIVGGAFGIHSGNKKESANKEDKTESVDKNETDEEEKEEDKTDETVVIDDESEEDTTTESETPEVEETQQQTSTNTNRNQNNNNTNTNTGNNSGSNTGNSGGNTTATQPSTPTPTPTPTPEPEKSPYAGMYTMLDEASKTRFVQCGNTLRTGKAGQYIQVQETFIDYFNGNIIMSNYNTDGSWMYLCIAGWSTNKGSAETAPTYAELPSLAKQCIETIAPDGGTALYNTINSLILQHGGARYVPTQGRISESIPGLYVTVTQGRSGLEIQFWAE